MLRAVANSHTVIWYIYADERLFATARTTIEEAAARGDQIAFSSITLAEIVYLREGPYRFGHPGSPADGNGRGERPAGRDPL